MKLLKEINTAADITQLIESAEHIHVKAVQTLVNDYFRRVKETANDIWNNELSDEDKKEFGTKEKYIKMDADEAENMSEYLDSVQDEFVKQLQVILKKL